MWLWRYLLASNKFKKKIEKYQKNGTHTYTHIPTASYHTWRHSETIERVNQTQGGFQASVCDACFCVHFCVIENGDTSGLTACPSLGREEEIVCVCVCVREREREREREKGEIALVSG